ncbi:hypothetical protein ACSBR2_025414 [Camellia fascicularis]
MSVRRLYNASLMGALALLVHLCMVDLTICSSNFTDQLALLSFKSPSTMIPTMCCVTGRKKPIFVAGPGSYAVDVGKESRACSLATGVSKAPFLLILVIFLSSNYSILATIASTVI